MSLMKSVSVVTVAAACLIGCEEQSNATPETAEANTMAASAPVASPAPQSFDGELPIEPTPAVEMLPASYPKEWVFAHDLNFVEPQGGKVVILDVAADTRNYKGMMNSSFFGGFAQSATRPELYTGNTFYSRGTYGERSDFILIYDTATLEPVDEIELPGGKRAQHMTTRNNITMSGNDRFAYVFNFTPAASVQIVDMVERELLEEIQTPGCSQMYATGETNFAMQCAGGNMSVFEIDGDGKFVNRTDTEVFNDIDDNPLFVKYGLVNDVAYFPTFQGDIQPIALKDGTAEVLPSWTYLTDEDKAANWRPGGWQLVDARDQEDELYILMHADGFEGSHKNGGSEIWVIDVNTQKKVRSIPMPNWGITFAVTQGEKPYVAVTNGNFEMDVFDGMSGEYLRTIGGGATQHAFQIYPGK